MAFSCHVPRSILGRGRVHAVYPWDSRSAACPRKAAVRSGETGRRRQYGDPGSEMEADPPADFRDLSASSDDVLELPIGLWWPSRRAFNPPSLETYNPTTGEVVVCCDH